MSEQSMTNMPTPQTGTGEAGRSETRRFRLHEHEILKDIITRQAGTLTKALLEAVMNAKDAGASEIEIKLEARRVTIRDNGRGFENREEIETNFEVFGQPQTEEERGRKTYAEFRMGRGQCFHFGINRWRTNTFAMEIDVQKCLAERTGFQYVLTEDLPSEPGCHITVELYHPLAPREISDTVRELKQRVRYVPATITINDRVATIDPEDEKWTLITDDAYMRLSESGHLLEVFNNGIFVDTYPRRTYGAAGVIVSKKRLTVNFARNEIISSCPVWRRISERFDYQAAQRIKKKFTLDDEERANVIARIITGEINLRDTWQMQILVDANGLPWSPSSIARAAFPQFTTAFAGDPRADTLIANGVCLVLDQECVDLFELDDPRELFTKYNLLRHHHAPVYVPYEQIAEELSTECLPVPKHRWTPTERIWIALLKDIASNTLENRSYQDDNKEWHPVEQLVENPHRVIRIGSSKICKAWTDGTSYIFVAREWLADLQFVKHDLPYFRDLFAAAQTIAAQFCFSDNSRTGGFSPEFYKTFYALSKILPYAVTETSGMLTPAKLDQLRKRVAEEARRDLKQASTTGAPAEEETTPEEEEWPDTVGEANQDTADDTQS